MTGPLTGAFGGYSYKGAFGNDAQTLSQMGAGLAKARAAEEERKRQAALEAALQRVKEEQLSLDRQQVAQGDARLQLDRDKLNTDREIEDRKFKQEAFEAKMKEIAEGLERGTAEEQGQLDRESAERIAQIRANRPPPAAQPGKGWRLVKKANDEYAWVPPPNMDGSGASPPGVQNTGVFGTTAKAPAAQKTAYDSNIASIQDLEAAIREAEARPESFGLTAGNLLDRISAGQVSQRTDPGGVTARARVADIGSMKIHDRSGAAVTAKEFPRLRPFIPSDLDAGPTVIKKLKLFHEALQRHNEAIASGNPNDPRLLRREGDSGGPVTLGADNAPEPDKPQPKDRWEELVDSGMSPDEATEQVKQEFGL